MDAIASANGVAVVDAGARRARSAMRGAAGRPPSSATATAASCARAETTDAGGDRRRRGPGRHPGRAGRARRLGPTWRRPSADAKRRSRDSSSPDLRDRAARRGAARGRAARRAWRSRLLGSSRAVDGDAEPPDRRDHRVERLRRGGRGRPQARRRPRPGPDAGNPEHARMQPAPPPQPAGPEPLASSRTASRSMPSARAAAAPPSPSVARSGGRSTSASRSVAMSLNARSSSACSISARRTDGFSRIAPAIAASSAAVAAQQVGGGLLADPLRARQPVGRVAAQRDEVGHGRRRDAVALLDLRGAHLVRALLARALEQDRDPVARALEHVAVAGEDLRLARPPPTSRLGVGVHQVVGLEVVVRRSRSSRAPRRAPARAPTGRPAGRASAGRCAW